LFITSFDQQGEKVNIPNIMCEVELGKTDRYKTTKSDASNIGRTIRAKTLHHALHIHRCYGGEQIKEDLARMAEMRNAYKILVGKPEGKRPLGRPRRRWEDNIKMYHMETGLEGVDYIYWFRLGTGSGLL
jgi:hypothetical protein